MGGRTLSGKTVGASVECARIYAIRAFGTGVRHGRSIEEQIIHAGDVARLVTEAGGSPAERAAAWLHDVAEDTRTTVEDIRNVFGDEIANIVDGLTDSPEIDILPLVERKKAQAKKIASKGPEIKRPKLADQICNLRQVAISPPRDWTSLKTRNYIKGARIVAVQCFSASSYLKLLFDEAYQKALHAHSYS